MLLIIVEFLAKLVTGDVWRVWKEHKITEAQNEQNNVYAMSDDDVAQRLRDDYTRK